MLISYINNGSMSIVVVPDIDKVTWIIEVDQIYFGLMTLKCGFGWTRACCISVLIELFFTEDMLVIDLEELLYCILFMYEQGTTERACLQFTGMLH